MESSKKSENFFYFSSDDGRERYKYKNLDVGEWVKNGFINKCHFVFAPTKCGKTIYTSVLIYHLIRAFREIKKFWIYQIGATKDAQMKFAAVANHLNENYNVDFKFSNTTDIKRLKDTYEYIKNAHTSDKPKIGGGTSEKFNSKEWRFIFYLDDVATILQDSSNKLFFSDLISNGRHYGITTIVNSQIIEKIPDVIKTQNETLSIMGKHSLKNLGKLFQECPILNETFRDFGHFKGFWIDVVCKKKIEPFSILIFKKDVHNFFTYKVSPTVVNYFEQFRNESKECGE